MAESGTPELVRSGGDGYLSRDIPTEREDVVAFHPSDVSDSAALNSLALAQLFHQTATRASDLHTGYVNAARQALADEAERHNLHVEATLRRSLDLERRRKDLETELEQLDARRERLQAEREKLDRDAASELARNFERASVLRHGMSTEIERKDEAQEKVRTAVEWLGVVKNRVAVVDVTEDLGEELSEAAPRDSGGAQEATKEYPVFSRRKAAERCLLQRRTVWSRKQKLSDGDNNDPIVIDDEDEEEEANLPPRKVRRFAIGNDEEEEKKNMPSEKSDGTMLTSTCARKRNFDGRGGPSELGGVTGKKQCQKKKRRKASTPASDGEASLNSRGNFLDPVTSDRDRDVGGGEPRVPRLAATRKTGMYDNPGSSDIPSSYCTRSYDSDSDSDSDSDV